MDGRVVMWRWLMVVLAIPCAATLIGLIGWRLWLVARYSTRIHTSVETVPPHHVAIVLGAGVRGERPTAVLARRIEAAARLYQAGRVAKILMTGDGGDEFYDEPAAMQSYAIQLGVPEDDIVLDNDGRRTYDSCYRARAVFDVEEAVIVTQPFHLPRSLYLCETLGIRATGLAADQSRFSLRLRLIWELREAVASAAAWWDTHIAPPMPTPGELTPISVRH
jgi:SanA protein